MFFVEQNLSISLILIFFSDFLYRESHKWHNSTAREKLSNWGATIRLEGERDDNDEPTGSPTDPFIRGGSAIPPNPALSWPVRACEGGREGRWMMVNPGCTHIGDSRGQKSRDQSWDAGEVLSVFMTSIWGAKWGFMVHSCLLPCFMWVFSSAYLLRLWVLFHGFNTYCCNRKSLSFFGLYIFPSMVLLLFLSWVIEAVKEVNDDHNLLENRKKVWNYSDDFAKRPFIFSPFIIFVVPAELMPTQ